jgi:hypothetical protein
MSSITFEDSYLGQSAGPIIFVPAEDSPVVLTEVVQVTPFLLVPYGLDSSLPRCTTQT